MKWIHNCVGFGKGIATMFSDEYSSMLDVKDEKFQMSKISSRDLDIINIYRSKGASSADFLFHLMSAFDTTKKTMIVGDLNICGITEKNHTILVALKKFGFQQLIKYATHVEGRQIDHVFIYFPEEETELKITIHQSSPYFTDHDMFFITKVKFSYLISIYVLFDRIKGNRILLLKISGSPFQFNIQLIVPGMSRISIKHIYKIF